MEHSKFGNEEISKRGGQIYEQNLRDELEAANLNEFLIIDIESGDYEIDDDDLAASDRAHL